MFSLITSLYRSDKYLDSFSRDLKNFADALNESKVEFELIAILNDPTTREIKFTEEFKGQPWFRFETVGREPLYATWNRGVALAKGEILGFWNVDDIRFPGVLVEARELFSRGFELVYFPFYIKRYFKIGSWYLPLPSQKIDSRIPEYNAETRSQFFEDMNCGPFFMFSKELYNRVGPFDEQFKIAGDFDWCVRAAKVSEKFKKAKTPAGQFRVDGGGLSAGGSMRHTVENNLIYKRGSLTHKILPEDPEVAKAYKPEQMLKNGQWFPVK